MGRGLQVALASVDKKVKFESWDIGSSSTRIAARHRSWAKKVAPSLKKAMEKSAIVVPLLPRKSKLSLVVAG